jgi:hypothetical protein
VLAGGLAVFSLAGCGDSSMSEVSGKVTVDGQPVDGGAISFVPVDGQGPTSGSIIREGRYTFQAPLGEMKVSVSAPKVIGTKKIYDTPNSPTMPITEEALPKKYNEETELRFTVQRGANAMDWNLKSK